MRGYRAFTTTWQKPVQPAAVPKIVLGRRRLLSDADRKALYQMDQLIQDTRADMLDIFRRSGILPKQGWSAMQYIRKHKG